jgi:nucleoside-diphosphate kinase
MSVERSLVIVKPDGVSKGLIGEVIHRIEKKGFKIKELKMMTIDVELAQKHYQEHVSKPFFSELVSFITSGAVVAMVVEGEESISELRNIVGATDPKDAAPGTIRGDFATDVGENIVHASDSSDSAKREIKLFFGNP